MKSIQISQETYDRLKALAEPLVDDASSVIGRLLEHWNSSPPKTRVFTVAIGKKSPPVWHSSRGEEFIVGTKLRATHGKHKFEAAVTESGIEFDGIFYDNPSSAGTAAKKSIGLTDAAASTNGWKFWEMWNPNSKRWASINILRLPK